MPPERAVKTPTAAIVITASTIPYSAIVCPSWRCRSSENSSLKSRNENIIGRSPLPRVGLAGPLGPLRGEIDSQPRLGDPHREGLRIRPLRTLGAAIGREAVA